MKHIYQIFLFLVFLVIAFNLSLAQELPFVTDVMKDRINWASKTHGSRVITAHQTQKMTADGLLDELSTDESSWVRVVISNKSYLIIDLGQEREINALQFNLLVGYDRIYRYRLESSTDGTNYNILVDRSIGDYRGIQRLDLPSTTMRFIRLSGTFASEGGSLFLTDEFFAIGDEPTSNIYSPEQITIDGALNASGTFSSGVKRSLNAGIYKITYQKGAISAWAGDTDNNGKTWQARFDVSIPAYGKNYVYAAVHDKLTSYSTPIEVETTWTGSSFTINLPTHTDVYFWFNDLTPTDNRGSTTITINQLSGPNDSLLEKVRDAMTRSVMWEQQEVAKWQTWITDRNCFGCHIQTQASVGLAASKEKLPRLPVFEPLEQQLTEAYLGWQNPQGWVSPKHNGAFAVAQTSLWAWAVSHLNDRLLKSAMLSLFNAMDWLILKQQVDGGWNSDHDAPALYSDGKPSATHTSDIILALRQILSRFSSGDFISAESATVQGSNVSLENSLGTIWDFKFKPLSGITGVMLTIDQTFATNQNFVISEFQPFGGTKQLPIASATASREQSGYPISESINGILDKTNDGWAVNGNVHQTQASGLWKFSNPSNLDRVRLWQSYIPYQIKQVSVAVTTDPSPTLSSQFIPVQIENVGRFLDNDVDSIGKYQTALTKAAELFYAEFWDYQRNTRTAAHTVTGLHGAIPFLTSEQRGAARTRLTEVDDYLRRTQHGDGGWSDRRDGTGSSQVYPSAQALYALILSSGQKMDDAIKNAADYLLRSQHVDGSWNSASIQTRLATTTWVEIALPPLFDLLEKESFREAIIDLTAEGNFQSVHLLWTPTPGAVGYNIYRRQESTSYVKIASDIVSDIATYIDKDVTAEATYIYKVRWLDQSHAEFSDSNEASATPTGLICGGDSSPIIISAPVTGAIVDKPYAYKVEAKDADANDVLTFKLTNAPPGATINPSSGLVTWLPQATQEGSHLIGIKVEDKIGRYAIQNYRLFVSTIIVNDPPTIVSTPLLSAKGDHLYQYRVRVTDPNKTDVFQYSLVTPPSGMTINPTTGLISWTPENNQAGSHPVTVQVTDSGGLSDSQQFTINVTKNTAPVITTSPQLAATKNKPYFYDVDATDAEGDRITFSLITKPEGMRIDSIAGRIEWSPTKSDVGTHSVTVRASDFGGLFSEQVYQLEIPANQPPAIVSTPIVSTSAKQAYSYKVLAEDPETDSLTYTLTLAPTGMSISSSGEISWTPNTENVGLSNAVTIEVTDPSGLKAIQLFEIAVDNFTPPQVSIISPKIGGQISSKTDFIGSIIVPPGQAITWKAGFRKPGAKNQIPIGTGTGPITNGLIGSLDSTLLSNDNYELVIVIETLGKTYTNTFPYDVVGNLKLGAFRIGYLDLTVPAGPEQLPLMREYNTLERDISGDFGPGWRLRLPGRVVDSVPEGQAFRDGARVFVTKANGERVGFSFHAYLTSLFFPVYKGVFVPDPGVNESLEATESMFFKSGDTYFLLTGPYNPNTYLFITKDQTRYTISETQGLLEIRDINKNVISFKENAITESNGNVIKLERDSQKRITSITDASGGKITYFYDEKGDLTKVSDQLGQVTQFNYNDEHFLLEVIDSSGVVVLKNVFDEDGRLKSQEDAKHKQAFLTLNTDSNTEIVTDRLGNKTTSVYDDMGNLIRREDAQGGVRQYSYDSNFNLIHTVNELGETTSFSYDKIGNLLSKTDAQGNTTRLTYNSLGQVLKLTTPLGVTIERTYDGFGNLLTETNFSGFTKQNFYNAKGHLIKQIDALGNITQSTYDERGRVTEKQNALGQSKKYSYDNGSNVIRDESLRVDSDGVPHSVINNYSYDSLNRITKFINAEGQEISIEYNHRNQPIKVTDAEGFIRQREYDELGQLTKVIYPDGGIELSSYDAEGRLIERTNPDGRKTRYEYDTLGQLVKTIFADGTEDSQEYDLKGNIISETDASGNKTSYQYDSLGRRIKMVDALGKEETYRYDVEGNRIETIDKNGVSTKYEYDPSNRLTKTIYPDGSFTVTTYDGLGRVIAETNEVGNLVQTKYDALSRIVERIDEQGNKTLSSYDTLGNLLSSTDAKENITKYDHNNLGQLVKTRLPLGMLSTSTYDKNGNLISTTDFNERTTTNKYDSNNRLVETKDANNGVTKYEYDKVGNRIAITDPLNNRTEFAFDNNNRLLEQKDPLGKVTRYEYDKVGNKIKQTDRNGRIRRFTYDSLNQLTSEEWLASDQSVLRTISYTYDPMGNVLSEADPDSKYVYTYDVRGRLKSVNNQGTPSVPNLTLNYEYDFVGNLTEITDSAGVVVKSLYDPRSLLISRNWNGSGISPVRVDLNYDATNHLTAINRFADLVGTNLAANTNYVYDSNNRNTQIAHKTGTDTSISSFDYQFNPGGERIQVKHHGATVDYTYDNLGQLKQATDSVLGTESFTYDANGNRTGSGYVVSKNNRITQDSEFNYAYDNEGNLISKTDQTTNETVTYNYDYRNRLVLVKQFASDGITIVSEVGFIYDVKDRRIAKVVNGIPSYFVYNQSDVWAEFDNTGNPVARYLPGSNIDNIFSKQKAGEGINFYLADTLGTVYDVADASGVITGGARYKSFGSITSQTGASDRYTFTGREFDSETGLYYYRARYFDPNLGRFISQDPLGFDAGDANLYRYVGNSPGNGRDPSGTLLEGAILNFRLSGPVLAAATAAPVATLIYGNRDAIAKGAENVRDAILAGGINRGYGLLAGKYTATSFLALGAAIGIAVADKDDPNIQIIALPDGTIEKIFRKVVDAHNEAFARVREKRRDECDPKDPQPISFSEQKQRGHICNSYEWWQRVNNLNNDFPSCFETSLGGAKGLVLGAWTTGYPVISPNPTTEVRKQFCFGKDVGRSWNNSIKYQCVTIVVKRQDCSYHGWPSNQKNSFEGEGINR